MRNVARALVSFKRRDLIVIRLSFAEIPNITFNLTLNDRSDRYEIPQQARLGNAGGAEPGLAAGTN